jgi:hypothetical protein
LPYTPSFSPLETYMYQNYDDKGFNGYTVALLIEQPVPHSRQVVDEALKSGHAFLRIAKHGQGQWTTYVGFRAKDFSEPRDITGRKMKGEFWWFKDAQSPFTLGRVFVITQDQAQGLLSFSLLWEKNNATYDLLSNNCATFPIMALEHVGISSSQMGLLPREWNIPQTIRNSWIFKHTFLATIDEFSGYSPADLGEDLRKTRDWFEISQGSMISKRSGPYKESTSLFIGKIILVPPSATLFPFFFLHEPDRYALMPSFIALANLS